MWTVYTYWDSSSVISALNAVAMIMGSGDFMGLMQAVALIGLLTAAGMGLFKISFKEPAQYIGMLVLFNGLLFVPKVTVSVQDIRSGAVGTVANVPLGVAFISTTTSHIGKYLTETFETVFGLGDELKFSKTGMAWGARALKTMSETRPVDQKAQEAFSTFVRACIVPEISQSAGKYAAITSSQDIMTLLASGRGTVGGWLNPGRVVNMPNMTSDGYTVMPCITAAAPGSAYDLVNTWLTSQVGVVKPTLAQRLLPDAPPATANALIATYLPGVEGAIIGTSRSINQQLMQAMTVNLMNEGAGNLGLALNDPGAVQMAVGVVTAEASTASSYRVMGMIGEEALPKFRNLIEIMLICVFPLVALSIIVAGESSGMVLKTYAMTAVWVQLWAPLYAIINNMLVPLTASRMQAIAGGSVSQNMANTASMIQTGMSEQAMAGALVMAVPMIAYALVKGGEVAMSSATSSLMGGLSSAASQQGSQAGLGNVSVGNTSWGNHSSNNVGANKWDTNASMSRNRVSDHDGLMQRSFDTGTGQQSMNASAMVSDLGEYSAQASGQIQQGLQRGLERSQASASRAAEAFKESTANAYSNFKRNEGTSGTSNGVTKTGGYGDTSSTGKQASNAMSSLKEWAQRNGVSEEQAFGYAMALKAGLPGDFIGPSIATNSSSSAKVATEKAALEKIAGSSDFKALTDKMATADVKTSGTQGAQAGKTNSSGVGAELTKSDQYAKDYTKSTEEAQKYSQALTATSSMTGSGSRNLSNQIVKELGGEDAAVAAVRSGDHQSIQKAISKVVDREIQSALGGNFGPSGSQPKLGGDGEVRAQQLRGDATTATSAVQKKVEGGEGTVVNNDAANKKKLAGPVATASLGGQTAQSVTTKAAGTIQTNEQAVNNQGTAIAKDGDAVKTDVQKSAEAALKPGGLTTTANSNAGTAAFNLIDGPAKALEAGTTALLESAAQDTAKSLGYPPAPPPPPPPPTPVQSKWGMGPSQPLSAPTAPSGAGGGGAKK